LTEAAAIADAVAATAVAFEDFFFFFDLTTTTFKEAKQKIHFVTNKIKLNKSN